MKTFCGLLFLCLLWITPIASQTKTDKEGDDLVGPVKRVEVYLIEFIGQDNETKRRRYTTTYNTEGNKTERVLYDPNNKIMARELYTFDSEGRSTGYEEYVLWVDKALTTPRRHVYTLDAAGRRVEYTVFESNGSIGSRSVFKYDAKGNLIEQQWYAHTGRLIGRTVLTFDENGNQTSLTSYQEDNAPGFKHVSKYDANGNKTEALQYEGKTLRYKFLNSYDSKGRILVRETIEFNSRPASFPSHAPQPGKVVYTYDDEKRTKEEATYDVNGTLKGKVTRAFDERNNEIGLKIFNAYGPVETSENRLTNIEYDSNGNWTRKTYFSNPEKGGQPQANHVELRVITYH